MADLESIVRMLVRGGGSLAESARAEAQRVLEELVARGDLGRAEAAEIEEAVVAAAEAHRRWLDERVVAPLRGAWRSASDAVGRAAAESEAPAGRAEDEVRARLAAIEERLARIEQALVGRSREGET
jgi:polyhydroxyalkanoate synthesis regulator phasin